MSTRQSKRGKSWISFTVICVVLGAGAYLIHLGSTKGWPETDCTVNGSRVVRDVAAPVGRQSRVVILYKIEYHLRYTVRGKDYYVWASSGKSDAERQSAEAKAYHLPDYCGFRIRYNPFRPSEAVAVP